MERNIFFLDGASGNIFSTIQRVFLVADPEICHFKVLNFEQMLGMLSNEAYNMDFLDIGGRASKPIS